MPAVVFCVDSVQDQTIVNDNWTETPLSLTVIECFSVLSDLIEKCLPLVDIVSKLVVNFL